jgi:hypothetical protein
MKRSASILIILCSVFLLSCFGDEGQSDPDGEAPSSIFVSRSEIGPGDICSNGGIRIDMGFDVNRNNVLDAAEITNTEYVCNGEDADGYPFVVYTSPQNNDTGVYSDTVITVVFNKDVDATTITDTSFFIKESGGNSVDGTISYNNGVAVFTPDNDFSFNKKYVMTITSDVSDLDGISMVYDHVFSFITGGPSIVDSDFTALDVNDFYFNIGDSPFRVTSNFSMPIKGASGLTTISWTSNSSLIAITGNTANITRPPLGDEHAAVNITASISDGSRTKTKTLIVIVRAYGTGWGTPEIIDQSTVYNAGAAHAGIDNNGNVIAMWMQEDGNIWANRYCNGTGWGTAVLIETGEGTAYSFNYFGISKSMFFDNYGNGIVVWTQEVSGNYSIRTNRYDIATGWGADSTLWNNASFPRVAVDSNGNAIVGCGLQYIRYHNDTGWGTVYNIVAPDSGHMGFARIGFNGSGKSIAVWAENDGTRDDIWSSISPDSSNWSSPVMIETDNIGDADKPDIAVVPDGNGFAVWRQYDGTRYNIHANRYDNNTGWGTAAVIESNNEGDADLPQIVVDSRGNAIAVWKQFDGTRYNIWANRYYNGTGWTAAASIDAGNEGYSDYPMIAIDSGGNAIAVWVRNDGTRNNIWANRFSNGTGWGTATLIETDEGDVDMPCVAINPGGTAVVVWHQSDGTVNNVWSNRFED